MTAQRLARATSRPLQFVGNTLLGVGTIHSASILSNPDAGRGISVPSACQTTRALSIEVPSGGPPLLPSAVSRSARWWYRCRPRRSDLRCIGSARHGNPAGPTRIVEKVTLSADGNSFGGTFSLRATDPAGKTTALHHRHDHGDSRHHTNDDPGIALRESLVRN